MCESCCHWFRDSNNNRGGKIAGFQAALSTLQEEQALRNKLEAVELQRKPVNAKAKKEVYKKAERQRSSNKKVGEQAVVSEAPVATTNSQKPVKAKASSEVVVEKVKAVKNQEESMSPAEKPPKAVFQEMKGTEMVRPRSESDYLYRLESSVLERYLYSLQNADACKKITGIQKREGCI